MSVVTDIILVTAIQDGGEHADFHPNVDKLNDWLLTSHRCALKKVDEYGGGNKCIQCDIFVGAINFLDEEGLIAAFRSIEWDCNDMVQLMLKREEAERFTVYQLDYSGNVTVLSPDRAIAEVAARPG